MDRGTDQFLAGRRMEGGIDVEVKVGIVVDLGDVVVAVVVVVLVR